MEKSTIKLSELKEMIKSHYGQPLLEKKKDKEEDEEKDEKKDEDKDEEDIDLEDMDFGDEEGGDEEMDMDMDMGMRSGGGDADEILNLLIQAKNGAEGLNDPKLMRQLGNTITMITRKHIARTDGEVPEMD